MSQRPPGLRLSRRSRATGTRVSLYHSAEAGLDPGHDGEWAWTVTCVDHAALVGLVSQRLARYHMADPSLWCPRCQAVAELPRVWAAFERLRRDVRGADPDFDVTLDVNDDAGEPCCRQFAFCETRRAAPARISVASKLDAQSDARIEGVLRHEFGHAVLFFAGRIQHTERQADEAAARLWGEVIGYDDEDVQRIGGGTSPRPLHLG